jgi:hypothetical protein
MSSGNDRRKFVFIETNDFRFKRHRKEIKELSKEDGDLSRSLLDKQLYLQGMLYQLITEVPLAREWWTENVDSKLEVNALGANHLGLAMHTLKLLTLHPKINYWLQREEPATYEQLITTIKLVEPDFKEEPDE